MAVDYTKPETTTLEDALRHWSVVLQLARGKHSARADEARERIDALLDAKLRARIQEMGD